MAKKKDEPVDVPQGVLAAILAEIQKGPGGGAAPAQRPLGVPAGYVAEGGPLVRPAEAANFMGPIAKPAGVPARFFEEHVWQPAARPAEQIAALQSSLVRAGLIGKKDRFRVGVWDETSQQAYRRALELANAAGVDEQQAIAMYANAQPQNEDAGRAPLVKRLPNPADLRSTFQTVARNTIGRGVDPALIDDMVNVYQQRLGQQQQQAYDLDETGGTVTEAPAADTFAEEQIRAAQPAEAGAHDVALRYGKFLNMLGPGGGML